MALPDEELHCPPAARSQDAAGPDRDYAAGAELRYQALFNNATEGIYQTTSTGRLIEANPAFAKMFGYESPRAIIADISDIGRQLYVNPQDRHNLLKLLEEKGGARGYEARVRRRDGTVFWVSINVHSVRTGTGNVLHYEGTNVDITERKRLETELKQSEDRFRSILEQSFDGFVLIDIAGRIVEWNKAMEELTALSRDMVLGRYYWEILFSLIVPERKSPERLAYLRNITLATLETGTSPLLGKLIDAPMISAKGTRHLIQQTVFFVNTAGGRYLASVTRDVTGKIMAEARESRQLEQALRADKLASLGTLTAGLAHEISNPNMFVALHAPLLRDFYLDLYNEIKRDNHDCTSVKIAGLTLDEHRAMAEKSINDIVTGTERIKTIVQELKNYARETPSELQDDVDLNEVIKATITLTGNKIRNSTDHFDLELGTDIPVFRGNRQKLSQIAVNLITNAAEALTNKRQAIRIRTGFNAESNEAFLSVTDDGSGMSPEVLAHVADPFFTTKRNTGGTGLGVSISTRIAREHGGRLDYTSKEGLGTTATLLIPLGGTEKRGTTE